MDGGLIAAIICICGLPFLYVYVFSRQAELGRVDRHKDGR